ncbi:hypothetical protein SOVF_066230 isoform A [Spinacia oleracea]|nr:hypothetical protein SOVF_066230 isoform A [Spinacia oleracea]
MENNLNSQLLFQNNNTPLRFGRAPGNQGSKPGYMEDKLFTMDHRERGYFSPEIRRTVGDGEGVYGEGLASPRRGGARNWNGSGAASTPSSGEEEEEEEEEDDDEDDEEGDGEVLGLVGIGGKNSHSSACGGSSSGIEDKIGGGNSKDHALFGSSTRKVMIKDGGILKPGGDANRVSTSENDQHGRVGHFQKMVTVAEHDGDMYYMQLLQGTEGSNQAQKDIAGDNGCGFNGRRDSPATSDPGESLRAIFSDPITGALMDDAMILPCGHSFGDGGIQQVIKMKACCTCSHPVTEESAAPNLSLRIAVQAFRREEDLQMYKASKRRRERFEQDKGNNYGDSSFLDSPRGRGVQFPFVVTDRVIIKGNKRTPERFVGREAIVTTQCLNGWYVVKTVDNAESVKLQYRSLEKVSDKHKPSSKPISEKVTPNWL